MDKENRLCSVPVPSPGGEWPGAECLHRIRDIGHSVLERYRQRWLDTTSRYLGLGPLATPRGLA